MKKSLKIIGFSISSLLAVMVLAMSLGLVRAESAPSKCYMKSVAGSSMSDCGAIAGSLQAAGVDPGQFADSDPPSCFVVEIGLSAAVTKTDCSKTPFGNSNAKVVVCNDGTATGSPDQSDEDLCKDHSGVKGQTINCIDGTDENVPGGADDQAKIDACKDHCGYNAPGGVSDAPECKDKATAEPINTDRSEIRNCDGRGDATKVKHCLDINPIVKIIQDVLVFLTAVVGIAVIGSIIMGGIQYSASHGDPNVVAKAKSRITNALIAFVAYIFLYAFLQWLIPGGPF